MGLNYTMHNYKLAVQPTRSGPSRKNWPARLNGSSMGWPAEGGSLGRVNPMGLKGSSLGCHL